MAKRSRLSRNYIRKSKQNLVLTVIAIGVVLFILVRYGIPFLSDTSSFVGQITGGKSSEQAKKTEKENFISAPTLDPIPSATKDQNQKITGTSLPDQRVELFVNGSKEDETQAKSDGSFEFNIQLTEGENIIKARAISGDQKSDFTESLTIDYKKSNPNLTINNPSDGQNLKGGNTVTVSGNTEPGNSVTVNGFLAIIDSSGNWSYDLTLVNGGNQITVDALDDAGNKTEKTIHINYSP